MPSKWRTIESLVHKNSRALHGTLFLFGTDGYGFQKPRVQMVRGYGFHTITGETWMVPEKLGLLRSGLRSLVKSAIWLRSGLRFQVKSAGRFRSGLYSTFSFPIRDISHAFNVRHAFTATYQLFYISTSTVSPAAASCADCTSWRYWLLRLSCCATTTALYFWNSGRHPWLNFRNIICSTLNGLMLARKVSIKNDSEEKLCCAWHLVASTPW